MKLKKRLLVFSCSLLCCITLHTQSFDDYRNDKSRDFRRYLDASNSSYEECRKVLNKEYAECLRNEWVIVQGNVPLPASEDKSPDIPIPPPYLSQDSSSDTSDLKELPLEKVVPFVTREEPTPLFPIIPSSRRSEPKLKVTFYGTVCRIRFDDSAKYKMGDASENSASAMWSHMSESGYSDIVADCLDAKKKLHLCDWAYYQLVHKTADAVFGPTNEKTMLEAFILCQSGYKLRIGKDNGNVFHILLAFYDGIANCPFYTLGGSRYYLLDKEKNGGMHICDLTFPGEKPMRLEISVPPSLPDRKSSPRTLRSKKYSCIQVSATINENLMEFYTDYPKPIHRNDGSEWSYQANTPLSEQIRNAVYPTIRSFISGKSQTEAANILIDFVQTAFEYRRDNEYWGYERVFFPEETLYYPCSDCEDRAILFSRLVRDLMGLEVVLVEYPNHIATAIEFTDNSVCGDYFRIGGRKFVVSDPTYEGAPVGRTMPGLDNSKAKILILSF